MDGCDMSRYEQLQVELGKNPMTWLVTGVAGFIGSHLLQTLLRLDQRVVGLDNFSTGFQHNLDEVQSLVDRKQWTNFRFIHGDIRQLDDCRRACFGVDYVLHQAALGSVPRSLSDPISTNNTNISGFLNMLIAARDAAVKSFTYAASSSTYGDHPMLPKIEDNIGKPLSPYAVTKYVNELYADVFSRCYGFHTIGLRYFNVFGARQNPNGPYAAVIPLWVSSLLKGEVVSINGDGQTSRDFCYIDNAVQANILAATANKEAVNEVYNVSVGGRTTLNDLFKAMSQLLIRNHPNLIDCKPVYRDFRPGDVRHSQASIAKAQSLLGYEPTHDINEGLIDAMQWYEMFLGKNT